MAPTIIEFDDYISLADLVDKWNIPAATIIRLHGLPAIRFPNGRLYSKPELAAWLARRRQNDGDARRGEK